MHPREREVGLSSKRVLVVLAISAVLFVLLLPAIYNPPTPGGRAEAAATVRNIVNALRSYENDYGHFPEIVKPGPSGRVVICVGDPACKISDGPNKLLFDVLRAIPRGANANHALNPKKQKYFEMALAKDPKKPCSGFADGPKFSAADQGSFFDPWGRQYCIVFTTDGSGTLDLSGVYSDLAGPENLIRFPCAVFSLGKDGIPGGKGYEGKFRKPATNEAPNDVVSWQ